MFTFVSVRRTARVWGNGAIVGTALLVALPAVAVAERVRAGAGRRVATVAVRSVARACGIRFEVAGPASLEPGPHHVFVPNHVSPLDIPAMLVARPDARFLAAAELFRVPLLGAALRALGSVPIDRADPRAARRAIEAVIRDEDRGAIVVFAEGGIVPSGERRRFKTGAFLLAIETGASVVPVSIVGTAEVLPPRARVLVRPGTVRVLLHEPLPTTGLVAGDRKALRDRTERAVRGGLGPTAT